MTEPGPHRPDQFAIRDGRPAVLELIVELPFPLRPAVLDDELELAGERLINAYDLAQDVVLRAYRIGYTPARISQLTRLSLATVLMAVSGA